jgi:lipopolysaccharide export system permease protein
MKTLHKYLTRQVLASLLLSMVVFTFVFLLGNVLKDILALFINGQVRLNLVLEAIGLLVPFVWVFALPISLLTATLLVFGRFSADQELTAARASGISLLSLITPVLLLSLFCCGISAWINMDLGPRSRVLFKDLLYHARTDLAHTRLPENTYIPISTNYLFYAQKSHDGNLEGVKIWWSSRNTYITAPRGQLEMNATNNSFSLTLFDATALTVAANKPPVVWMFRKTQIPVPLNASAQQAGKPAISDMTFWQLRDELDNLNRKLGLPPTSDEGAEEASQAQLRAMENQREDLMEPIRVEMNREIAFSFACFSFTLVGIPLGIRVHRRETNVGVAIALVLVLIYYAFNMLAESLSARPDFAPHLIFWLPNFIFQAVGAVLLWRANRGI